MVDLRGRDFLKLLDFTPTEINHLLKVAATLKKQKHNHESHMYLKGKQIVKLKVFGAKGGILDNINVKVLKDAYFECHLDLDDANAHLVKNKDVGEIIYE